MDRQVLCLRVHRSMKQPLPLTWMYKMRFIHFLFNITEENLALFHKHFVVIKDQNWQLDSLDSSVTTSNGSEDKFSISNSNRPTSLPPTPCKQQIEHGIILKQLVLKGISSQLVTAQVSCSIQLSMYLSRFLFKCIFVKKCIQAKLKSKEATCLTVSTWIGIGTRNGLVLVFDVTQNLKWFLDTLDVLGTKNIRYTFRQNFKRTKSSLSILISFTVNLRQKDGAMLFQRWPLTVTIVDYWSEMLAAIFLSMI